MEHAVAPCSDTPSHTSQTIQKCMQMINSLYAMGFSKEKALRALASTGFHSVRHAASWLCLHFNDSLLDLDFVQDFFAVLRVKGDYAQCFLDSMQESRELLEDLSLWDNSAHICLVHFEVCCTRVPAIHRIFEDSSAAICSMLKDSDMSIKLMASPAFCYLGYSFLEPAARKIQDVSFLLSDALSRGIPGLQILNEWSCKTSTSSPDMLIACGFQPDQLQELVQLHTACLGSCETEKPITWSIELYSRDPRLRTTDPEVYEMLTSLEVSNPPISDPPMTNGGLPSPTSSLIGAQSDSSPTSIANSTNSTQPKLLPHHAGDFVLLLSSCSVTDREGCPIGLNLSTGATGLFNLNAAKRVSQYETWTLHGSIPLGTRGTLLRREATPKDGFHTPQYSGRSHSVHGCDSLGTASPQRCRQPSQQSAVSSPVDKSPKEIPFLSNNSATTSGSCTDSSALSMTSGIVSTGDPPSSTKPCWVPSLFSSSSYYADSYASTHSSPPTTVQSVSADQHLDAGSWNPNYAGNKRLARPKSRQLFIMRHAERVDACFGRSWITRCVDKKGVYRRFNLNLPRWLPPRSNFLEYALDSPITQVGLFASAELGRSLAEAGVRFTACYSSPSLRCVQTACELLRAMGHSDLLIRIEPQLFEWLGWYTSIPNTLSGPELKACGYPVDVTYTPEMSLADLNLAESVGDYYERSRTLVKRLLSCHKSKDSCLLIVAHASSLKACTHRLVMRGFRSSISKEEFHTYTSIVPYCAMVVAEERRRWTLVDPPVPNTCAYTHNPDFDWRQLSSTTLCGFPIQ